MPYLKWNDAETGIAIADLPRDGLALKLVLPRARIEELREVWVSLIETPGRELRTDLPKGWTLFWKAREGDTRALLAHPESETWVGTLVIDLERGPEFLAALDQLASDGVAFRSSTFPALNRISNLDLTLERA